MNKKTLSTEDKLNRPVQLTESVCEFLKIKSTAENKAKMQKIKIQMNDIIYRKPHIIRTQMNELVHLLDAVVGDALEYGPTESFPKLVGEQCDVV